MVICEHWMDVPVVPRVGEEVSFHTTDDHVIFGKVAKVWHDTSIPLVCVYVAISKDDRKHAVEDFDGDKKTQTA